MVIHQAVHDFIRLRTAVKDVADDVEMINNEPLNQLCHGNDEVLGAADFEDSLDDRLVVCFFVEHLRLFGDQLLDDIAIIRRQGFPHFGTGVFGRNDFADVDQAVQHDLVPVIDILLLLFLHLQALSRVIDKGCKRTFFRNTERVAEDIVNLLSHGTGTVAEYMRKGFVFAMNIRKEMLRAFGKVDNGLQIDDFGRCFFDGRVQFCEIFQIIFFVFHEDLLPGLFFLIL